HIPANTLLLAAFFGVLANPAITSDPGGELQNEPQNKFEYCLRLAIPALGLWLAIKGLPTLPGEYLIERARQQLVHCLQSPDPVAAHAAVESATRALSYDGKNPFAYL